MLLLINIAGADGGPCLAFLLGKTKAGLAGLRPFMRLISMLFLRLFLRSFFEVIFELVFEVIFKVILEVVL